jgi:leader peptidase (prepilin peptidase)/N-methyltransferase
VDYFWTFLFFAIGACMGSFLNVIADRLPQGKSIVSPPSHCEDCQRPLSVDDNIPIFSYLWLRGRCRYCHAAIPQRIFWVELGTAVLFAFLYWKYGFGYFLPLMLVYGCIFILLTVIDLEHGLLPNTIVYPAIAIAFAVAVASQLLHLPLLPDLKSAAIAGAIGFAFLLIPALISRGMGWGDVKLAAFIGLATGFPLVLLALFIGIVSGGLVASILLLLKIKGRKDAIPFGPFLSLGTLLTLLWGNNILAWLGFA